MSLITRQVQALSQRGHLNQTLSVSLTWNAHAPAASQIALETTDCKLWKSPEPYIGSPPLVIVIIYIVKVTSRYDSF